MPVGGPRIGRSVWGAAQTSSAEELVDAPESVELGTLDPAKLVKLIEDEIPPWETDPNSRRDHTNARQFVDVPDEWELRWLSPQVVDEIGMRHWQPVPAMGDPRVTVKVRTMIAPDNTVRRGSHRGSFLAFMPKSWIASRDRLRREKVAKLTQSAPDRQQKVAEEIRRGNFGRYVSVDSASHPTHTIGDGRSMTDP